MANYTASLVPQGGGLAEALGFKANPFTSYIGNNRNALLGLAAGIAGGDNWGQALGSGLHMAALGRQTDMESAEKLKADAKADKQANATLDYFRQKHPDLAMKVEAGLPVSEAWNEAMAREAPKAPAAPIKLGAGDTLLDPNTYEPLVSIPKPEDAKDAFNMEKDLTSQYLGTDPLKSYQTVRNGYEKVRASSQLDSGPGDISMIFAYMKMLDPTSVVREGEFATAENAGGVGQQISNIYNRLLSGERLTPELRKQFLAAADQLYAESSRNLADVNDQFRRRAGAWSVNPDNFLISPETYDANDPLGLR
jgi:hypothetical protein